MWMWIRYHHHFTWANVGFLAMSLSSFLRPQLCLPCILVFLGECVSSGILLGWPVARGRWAGRASHLGAGSWPSARTPWVAQTCWFPAKDMLCVKDQKALLFSDTTQSCSHGTRGSVVRKLLCKVGSCCLPLLKYKKGHIANYTLFSPSLADSCFFF